MSVWSKYWFSIRAAFTVVWLGIVTLGCAFFSYIAVQGEYGVFKRVQINSRAAELEQELASVNAEVEVMKIKTKGLSPESLDLDLLDERARKVLGLVRTDEIVIN